MAHKLFFSHGDKGEGIFSENSKIKCFNFILVGGMGGEGVVRPSQPRFIKRN